MTTGGWIMFGLMWGMILATSAYCFAKVLSQRKDADP